MRPDADIRLSKGAVRRRSRLWSWRRQRCSRLFAAAGSTRLLSCWKEPAAIAGVHGSAPDALWPLRAPTRADFESDRSGPRGGVPCVRPESRMTELRQPWRSSSMASCRDEFVPLAADAAAARARGHDPGNDCCGCARASPTQHGPIDGQVCAGASTFTPRGTIARPRREIARPRSGRDSYDGCHSLRASQPWMTRPYAPSLPELLASAAEPVGGIVTVDDMRDEPPANEVAGSVTVGQRRRGLPIIDADAQMLRSTRRAGDSDHLTPRKWASPVELSDRGPVGRRRLVNTIAPSAMKRAAGARPRSRSATFTRSRAPTGLADRDRARRSFLQCVLVALQPATLGLASGAFHRHRSRPAPRTPRIRMSMYQAVFWVTGRGAASCGDALARSVR